MLMPEARGGVALRIEVDHQHPVAEIGEAGGQVHGGRRLADAALLVGDGDDAGEGPGEPIAGGVGSGVGAGVGGVRIGRRSRDLGLRRRHYDPIGNFVNNEIRSGLGERQRLPPERLHLCGLGGRRQRRHWGHRALDRVDNDVLDCRLGLGRAIQDRSLRLGECLGCVGGLRARFGLKRS